MATRQSAPGAPVNDRVRMNMQQVREQQELNRERKAQLESAAERNAAAREKTKSQYAHVSSRVSAATAAAIASGPAAAGSGRGAAAALRGLQGAKPSTQQQQQPEDDVKITVFVRECDPDGGVFSIFESEVIKQQQAALAQAAAGGAGTARGAARTTAARAPSNAPPPAAAAGGRPAPAAAFGRAAVATTSRAAPAPAPAPTTPLQPLPHNNGNATGASFALSGAGPGPRGAVPEYLRQRKQQLQDEKDRVARAIEDEKTRAQYPPGHRPLAEEERQAILSKLATRKKELEADLGRLPLRFDTIAVKNRRQEIMGEMNEVDEAVQKFSVKKQLFVPI